MPEPGSAPVILRVFGKSRPLVRPTSLPLDVFTLLDFDLIEVGKSENLDDVVQMGGDSQEHVTVGNPAGAVQRRGVHHDVRKPV